MLELDQIINGATTGEAIIGGKTHPIRKISALQSLVIDEAIPAPEPPLKKDPTKGDKAPRIPDDEDPTYCRELNEWMILGDAGRLAVAMRLGADENDKPDAAWISEAAAKLADSLDEDELEAAMLSLHRIGRGDLLEKS